MADLQNVTETFADKITDSPLNVLTTVDLLKIIANVSQSFRVDKPIMTNFLKTVDIIGSKQAQNTWQKLNRGSTTENASSALLRSTEEMGSTLTDASFSITTNSTQLNRTKTSGSFFGTFGTNSTTEIDIPQFNGLTSITTIVFSTLDNVLPVRNTTYNGNQTKINGDVAAIIVKNTVYNLSLTFDITNTSLGSPQCVFWNYSLLDGIGGWDSTGCEIKLSNQTEKITCVCNHTTSFSILMSPFFVDSLVLGFITFICVGISMICLILALIIEIIVWKPLTKNDTAYMRHVSMVNIALSLLIADICFIIGAAIVNKGEQTPVGPCSAATFFMHFFYLALFFWMLFSALLLLYRTILVFSRMSKPVMMVIAFFLGYGAPLLIAVITVASTAGGGGYIQEENACWLNWKKTMAMLAFVIPALSIVAINFLVLLVVICKMLRRGAGAATQPDEKHAVLVIARCVAILTPLFGLTWAFGIGTMVSSALGIHIVFALLNSLQGFFIFVFGILLDSKIREELAGKLSLKNFSSGQTKTTSTGVSSSSGQGRRSKYQADRFSFISLIKTIDLYLI
ncbi:adhesion G-protein coupled receptor F1-like [Colossoma macropomum]|uniref:adhesion G-protein coupled receptor F1-like n=1 Tax=Colossoma macropomum TaxID=42526 RepID=UPI00186403EF|nr:adhesion G-protein coupled receptor F1-like [Colossoma macropomum]